MKCKACKNEIPDGSIFCNWCGERQIKERKQKKELSVPKPRQLPSGTWYATMEINKKKHRVQAKTEAEYYAKARALKAGLISQRGVAASCTLRQALREYIDALPKDTPPATIRTYETIYKNRMPDYMEQDIAKINYQRLVDSELEKYTLKTVKGTWSLVKLALDSKKISYEKPKLPRLKKKAKTSADFLNYKQIQTFLEAIQGDEAELAAILALHSLRQAELLALTVDSIKDGNILVRGGITPNKDHQFVYTEYNKTDVSTRDVPIIIPRLYELLPDEGRLVTCHPSTIRRSIKRVCDEKGLPPISLHDLRRSFASLALHLKWRDATTMKYGGWKTDNVLRSVYQILDDTDAMEDIKRMEQYYSGESR